MGLEHRARRARGSKVSECPVHWGSGCRGEEPGHHSGGSREPWMGCEHRAELGPQNNFVAVRKTDWEGRGWGLGISQEAIVKSREETMRG